MSTRTLLLRAHGETGWTARLVPLAVDSAGLRQLDGDARLGATEDGGAGAGEAGCLA